MEREALKEAGVMFSSDEEDFNQGDSVLVRKNRHQMTTSGRACRDHLAIQWISNNPLEGNIRF